MTSTALPGHRRFSTSGVGSTVISKISCLRSDYEKFLPGLVFGLTGLLLAAHHHSGYRSYDYGLLQRSRSGI